MVIRSLRHVRNNRLFKLSLFWIIFLFYFFESLNILVFLYFILPLQSLLLGSWSLLFLLRRSSYFVYDPNRIAHFWRKHLWLRNLTSRVCRAISVTNFWFGVDLYWLINFYGFLLRRQLFWHGNWPIYHFFRGFLLHRSEVFLLNFFVWHLFFGWRSPIHLHEFLNFWN